MSAYVAFIGSAVCIVGAVALLAYDRHQTKKRNRETLRYIGAILARRSL